jgi:hypothetical protein
MPSSSGAIESFRRHFGRQHCLRRRDRASGLAEPPLLATGVRERHPTCRGGPERGPATGAVSHHTDEVRLIRRGEKAIPFILIFLEVLGGATALV